MQDVVVDLFGREARFIIEKMASRMIDHVRFFGVREGNVRMLIEVIMQSARPALLCSRDDKVEVFDSTWFFAKHLVT